MSLAVDHAGVVREARDHRDFVEVPASFTVASKGRVYDGVRLSRRHFVVRASSPDGVIRETAAMLVRDGEQVPLVARVNLSGFVLELEMKATRSFILGKDGGLWRFDVEEIDRRNEAALSQVVRLLLRGIYPTVDDFAPPSDPETALASANRKPDRRPSRRSVLAIGAAGVAALALVGYLGFAAYSQIWTARSTLAAVTAPRIDVFSPAAGVVRDAGGLARKSVFRDQPLVFVEASDLEADLQNGKAKLAYLNAMLSDAAAFDDSLRGTMAPVSFEGFEPAATKNPVVTSHARNLELGVIKSLETRKAALKLYAPCDCAVAWAADPGTTVKAGDRVMTLVKASPDDLRVEAFFDVAEAARLKAGQKAYVEDHGSSQTWRATVERVSLDPGDSNRIGLPQATRRDPGLATVILKLDDTPGAERIGSLLNVVILK